MNALKTVRRFRDSSKCDTVCLDWTTTTKTRSLFCVTYLFAQYDDEFEVLSSSFARLSVSSTNNGRKMSGIKPPKPLIANSDIGMCQEWTEWLEAFEDYATANKLSAEEATIQTATSRACAAFGKICSGCKRLGHFVSKCNSKETEQNAEQNRKTNRARKLRTIEK